MEAPYVAIKHWTRTNQGEQRLYDASCTLQDALSSIGIDLASPIGGPTNTLPSLEEAASFAVKSLLAMHAMPLDMPLEGRVYVGIMNIASGSIPDLTFTKLTAHINAHGIANLRADFTNPPSHDIILCMSVQQAVVLLLTGYANLATKQYATNAVMMGNLYDAWKANEASYKEQLSQLPLPWGVAPLPGSPNLLYKILGLIILGMGIDSWLHLSMEEDTDLTLHAEDMAMSMAVMMTKVAPGELKGWLRLALLQYNARDFEGEAKNLRRAMHLADETQDDYASAACRYNLAEACMLGGEGPTYTRQKILLMMKDAKALEKRVKRYSLDVMLCKMSGAVLVPIMLKKSAGRPATLPLPCRKPTHSNTSAARSERGITPADATRMACEVSQKDVDFKPITSWAAAPRAVRAYGGMCIACGEFLHKALACGRCTSVWYCDVTCLKSDLPHHQAECERMLQQRTDTG